jgi:hypothetical protein
LDAWGQLVKRGADEESSRNEIAEEALQRSMFPFPEAGGKAFASAKPPTVLRRDGFEVDICASRKSYPGRMPLKSATFKKMKLRLA